MFKLHTHGAVVLFTTSIQKDIYLPPNALIKLIVKSCLARAQTLYKVRVVAYSVSTTHTHQILVVDDPDNFKEFIRYFKAETAHAINNILGVPNRNLWNESYDSPVVLDPNRAIEALAYTYANPVKDNLVATVESYPGLNSFEYAKLLEEVQFEGVWIPRSAYRELPEKRRNPEGYRREAESLEAAYRKNKQILTISPHAWLDAFEVTEPEERKYFQNRVVERVREMEKEAFEKRTKDGKSVMGATALINTPIGAHYIPRRRGRRTYVIGSERSVRKKFISKLKIMFQEVRRIRDLQRRGESLPFPAGFYPPALTKLIQPLCIWDVVAGVA